MINRILHSWSFHIKFIYFILNNHSCNILYVYALPTDIRVVIRINVITKLIIMYHNSVMIKQRSFQCHDFIRHSIQIIDTTAKSVQFCRLSHKTFPCPGPSAPPYKFSNSGEDILEGVDKGELVKHHLKIDLAWKCCSYMYAFYNIGYCRCCYFIVILRPSNQQMYCPAGQLPYDNVTGQAS